LGEIVGASEDPPKSVDLMKKFLEDNRFEVWGSSYLV